MSKSQRDKGNAWERKVAAMLRDIYADARRCWQRQVDHQQPDVTAGPWWIEAKVGKKSNPRAALEQAEKDCPGGRIPAAIIKDDRKRPFVVLRLDDWLDFVREHEERGRC